MLRGAHRQFSNIAVDGTSGVAAYQSDVEVLRGLAGDSLELVAEFDPESREQFGFKLRRSPDGQEETLLYYDSSTRRMCVDKDRASLNPCVERGVQGGPFALRPGEPLQLHIFIDRSVIEVFINGRATLTTRVYPTRPDSLGIDLFCRAGQALLRSLDVWGMESI
ncbi:MAG: GH32 C-terminal domain-containing protein [Limnochordales bacterium]|nr:GH32 C-terminal domain-containing protein [Limnochordales bacterium]